MIYVFDEFRVDSQALLLFNRNQPVDVDAQTFDLIVFLIANRNRVVTRHEMIEALWSAKIVSDASLSNRINRARKYLGDDGQSQRYIKTLHGRGYQFVGNVTVAIDNEESLGSDLATEIEPQSIDLSSAKRGLMLNTPSIKLFSLSLVLIICIGTVSWFIRSLTSIESPKVEQSASVKLAVLPIEFVSDNENLAVLLSSLADYLTNRLASSLNIAVLHPETVRAKYNEFDDVWAIAKATQANYLIRLKVQPVES